MRGKKTGKLSLRLIMQLIGSENDLPKFVATSITRLKPKFIGSLVELLGCFWARSNILIYTSVAWLLVVFVATKLLARTLFVRIHPEESCYTHKNFFWCMWKDSKRSVHEDWLCDGPLAGAFYRFRILICTFQLRRYYNPSVANWNYHLAAYPYTYQLILHIWYMTIIMTSLNPIDQMASYC
jgi:hypothetical protein